MAFFISPTFGPIAVTKSQPQRTILGDRYEAMRSFS